MLEIKYFRRFECFWIKRSLSDKWRHILRYTRIDDLSTVRHLKSLFLLIDFFMDFNIFCLFFISYSSLSLNELSSKSNISSSLFFLFIFTHSFQFLIASLSFSLVSFFVTFCSWHASAMSTRFCIMPFDTYFPSILLTITFQHGTKARNFRFYVYSSISIIGLSNSFLALLKMKVITLSICSNLSRLNCALPLFNSFSMLISSNNSSHFWINLSLCVFY